MRILRTIVIGIAILAILFVGGAYLLPREVSVARSITIDAAAEKIFPQVNSLKATEAWSPWLERDPNVVLTYTGPDSGIGAAMAWASEEPDVGVGTQEIIASVANQSVETALDFGDMGLATARFTLVEQGTGTELTWGFTTDTGMDPIARWIGLMLDSWVGADYEQGLENLKALVEE